MVYEPPFSEHRIAALRAITRTSRSVVANLPNSWPAIPGLSEASHSHRPLPRSKSACHRGAVLGTRATPVMTPDPKDILALHNPTLYEIKSSF
ncbi:hypothetical protein E2C01_024590 [Portunus trituberculatus]|uniref:Uncharacterized protein n=1 Tax=Portunus trituberculatus TaxID=210409 RepID=A0A5B7EF73_PORTR|nr:hypothetical protein [Portunus trituberculatus]